MDHSKKIGVFEIGTYGWMYIKCNAGPHELEIRFTEDDLYDLKHAVDEMLRHTEAAKQSDSSWNL